MDLDVIRTGKLLAIQLFFTMTFALAGLTKWKGGVPDWFAEQFRGTWFGGPSMLAVSYYGIALAETVAFLGFAASLVMGEACRAQAPMYLQLSLCLSLFIFVGLAYGQRVTFKFQDAAFMFLYFVGTLVCLVAAT